MGEIENPCFSLWQKFLTPSVADITLAPIGTETPILKSCWVPRVPLNELAESGHFSGDCICCLLNPEVCRMQNSRMLETTPTMHYLRMPCSIEKVRKIVATKIDMVDNLSQHLHLLYKVWQHCWTMPALKGFLCDAVGASYFSLARFTVQQDKSSEENFSEQHLQCLQCTHVVHFPCKASTPIPLRIWNLEFGRVGKLPMLCRFGFLHASGLEIHHDLILLKWLTH